MNYPIEEALVKDMEKRESVAPQAFDEAKMVAVEEARALGLSDDVIFKALGIRK